MRWRIAQIVFFLAGLATIFAALVLSGVAEGPEGTTSVYIGFAIVLVAFLAAIATFGGLKRYPKVSYGRTLLFFFLFYLSLASGIVLLVDLPVSWLSVGITSGSLVFLLLLWAAIARYVRTNEFFVIPGASVKTLLSSFDNRFVFTEVKSPDRRILDGQESDGFVLDTKAHLDPSWVEFITQAQLRGFPVFSAHELIEQYAGRIALSRLDEATVTRFHPSIIYRVVKRALDIFVILVSLPISLPLMVLLALIIRIESPGAVIFSQRRIGEGGKPFVMYKFRSMLADAEAAGPAFADEDDSRVTRIGRFIRQVRLDELPQFWNIMRGEMSLVGPRPEQVQMAGHYEESIPFYAYRHLVKPGITGWAQVTHGYTADRSSTEVKLEHDLYYIKHYSVWLDLLIGIKTFKTILTGFGAR